MAGSFKHVLNEEGDYRGNALLENMGDMSEAVEQMAFMLLFIKGRRSDMVSRAEEAYYECVRGERAWPRWWKSE